MNLNWNDSLHLSFLVNSNLQIDQFFTKKKEEEEEEEERTL